MIRVDEILSHDTSICILPIFGNYIYSFQNILLSNSYIKYNSIYLSGFFNYILYKKQMICTNEFSHMILKYVGCLGYFFLVF